MDEVDDIVVVERSYSQTVQIQVEILNAVVVDVVVGVVVGLGTGAAAAGLEDAGLDVVVAGRDMM